MFRACVITASVVSALVYIKMRYLKSRRERLLMNIPGPNCTIFGKTVELAVSRENRYMRIIETIRKEYADSPLVRIWMGSKAVVFIGNASAAQELLTSKCWTQTEQSSFFSDFDRILLNTDFAESWEKRRADLTPAFDMDKLMYYMPIINRTINILIDRLTQLHLGAESFDFHTYALKYALDVSYESVFGKPILALMGDSKFADAMLKLAENSAVRRSRPWMKSDYIYKKTRAGRETARCLEVIYSHIKHAIWARREVYLLVKYKNPEALLNTFQPRYALIDVFLAYYMKPINGMTFQQIQDEAVSMIFKGFQAVGSALSWTIYNIGRSRNERDDLRREVLEVLGREEVQYMTKEQLFKLETVKYAIKESMRKHPPVPYYSRQMNEDINIAGHTIPAGTEVVLAPGAIQNDQRNFVAPSAFIPTRFMPALESARHPFAYLPFSAESRNCLGEQLAMMQLKAVVAQLVHHFEIQTTNIYVPDDYAYAETFLRPIDGHRIKISLRDLSKPQNSK